MELKQILLNRLEEETTYEDAYGLKSVIQVIEEVFKEVEPEQLILNGVIPTLKNCWSEHKPIKYKDKRYIMTSISTDGINGTVDLHALEVNCENQYSVDIKDIVIF